MTVRSVHTRPGLRGCGLPAAPTTAAVLAMLALFSAPATADEAEIVASRDNTLIENDIGELSNGAGDGIYCGRVGFLGSFTARRCVIGFDLSEIPAGSTVTSASLTLFLIQAGVAGDTDVALHRLLNDWGEGESSFPGGQGAPSQPGDATWIHTFFDDQFWDAAGGDFAATPSATQIVGIIPGPVAWSGPDMVADVQAWIDDPSGNHGWAILGEEDNVNTAKRFISKDAPPDAAEFYPRLTIEFEPGAGGCEGDTDGNNEVNVEDLVNVILDYGCMGASCIGDVNGDGVVSVEDLVLVILSWGVCR